MPCEISHAATLSHNAILKGQLARRRVVDRSKKSNKYLGLDDTYIHCGASLCGGDADYVGAFSRGVCVRAREPSVRTAKGGQRNWAISVVVQRGKTVTVSWLMKKNEQACNVGPKTFQRKTVAICLGSIPTRHVNRDTKNKNKK